MFGQSTFSCAFSCVIIEIRIPDINLAFQDSSFEKNKIQTLM